MKANTAVPKQQQPLKTSLIVLPLLLVLLPGADAATAPASGNDVPRCTDELCLVQALLDQKELIYIDSDIDLTGNPLPDVTTQVKIVGTCAEGSSCIIDAKGASRIFVVGLNGYLTLKTLELTGGTCKRGGACLISGSGSGDSEKGGKFAALNVKFTNNTASEFGGALYVESGGSAYLGDTLFQQNKASKGGALFVGSSKRFPEKHPDSSQIGPTCALTSCSTFASTKFVQNSADYGGAVYVDDAQKACKSNGGAMFDCTTCAFHENSAGQDGGAVFVNYQSSGAIANFQKTEFSQNYAGSYGGDISTQQGQYGTRGAQLYAYEVVFSESTSGKGNSSVAVKPFSFSTFAKCDFSGGHFNKSVLCEGSCDTFCPVADPLMNNATKAAGRNGESCPVPPGPLCDWVPDECKEGLPSSRAPTSPPPTPSLPPSSPPPPPPEASRPPPPKVSPSPPKVSPPPPSPSPPASPPSEAPSSSPSLGKNRRSPPPPPSSPPPPPVSPSPPSPASPPPASPPPSPSPPASPPPPPPASPPPPPTPTSPPPTTPPPTSPPPPLPSSPPPTPPPPPPPQVQKPIKSRHRNGSVKGDPHFVGKHGERFDFHGRSGRDYCIVSDDDFHVNMHVFRGIHKRTTFISKIGMLYKGDKVLVEAGVDTKGMSFDDQWSITLNNVELPKEQARKTSSGLKVAHLPHQAIIQVRDELDVNITVMHASHGKFGSGANYLDFQINKLRVTPRVHGVLGQTYRETLRTYQKIHDAKSRRVKRSRAASFFVDGEEGDYASSDILAPDCKFSAFMDQSLSSRAERMILEGVKPRDATLEKKCTGFGHSLCLSEGDEV